ncbi:MAG TPA: hypothetical protein PK082_07675, partial [Phycisphaerae bacterium]|nr:hypothetical protein [Phycisphaerae bacterium]
PAGVTADPVFVRVSEIPSDQILFGDTTFLTGGKWQQWAWFKSRSAAATETLLHTRHNETVNGLFHDGHVEASSPGELGKTGVLYYRDHQYVNQVTPTP